MVKDEIVGLAKKLAALPKTKEVAGMYPMGDEPMPGFPVAPADWARYAAVWAYYLAFLNIAPPVGFISLSGRWTPNARAGPILIF